MKSVTLGTEELGLHPLVSLTNDVAVLPGTVTWGSGAATESTSTAPGLRSSSRSIPSASRRRRSTSRAGRDVGGSSARGRGGSGGRKASRGLLVTSTAVAVSVHVGRSGVSGLGGRSGGLTSHVRGNVGGSRGVEFHTAELVLKSRSAVGARISNRSSGHLARVY